jgi:hypothetical protein
MEKSDEETKRLRDLETGRSEIPRSGTKGLRDEETKGFLN